MTSVLLHPESFRTTFFFVGQIFLVFLLSLNLCNFSNEKLNFNKRLSTTMVGVVGIFKRGKKEDGLENKKPTRIFFFKVKF